MEPLNKLGKMPPDPIQQFVRNKKKDFNNKIEKIRVLARKTINHFNDIKHKSFVVNPSIPILYFGDLNRYLKSDLKIVTAALNPSLEEFPKKGKPRFSFCPSNLNEDDFQNYMQTLSEYFKQTELNEPYSKWFDRSTEKIMNQLNTSYYPNKDYKNIALHTDICSPIATDPTWGGLEKKQKNLLEKKGFEIWLDLIKILKPDILLISVSKGILNNYEFIEISKLKINSAIKNSFEYNNIIKKYKEDGSLTSLDTKDIYFYQHHKISHSKIYKGQNNSGIPFGMIGFLDKEKKNKVDLKEIKHAADLIIKHMKE